MHCAVYNKGLRILNVCLSSIPILPRPQQGKPWHYSLSRGSQMCVCVCMCGRKGQEEKRSVNHSVFKFLQLICMASNPAWKAGRRVCVCGGDFVCVIKEIGDKDGSVLTLPIHIYLATLPWVQAPKFLSYQPHTHTHTQHVKLMRSRQNNSRRKKVCM